MVAPPLASKTIVPGTISVSFGVTDTGDASLSMALVVPPGRAGVEPSLAIHYSSNGGDSVLGRGFSISGSSAITRCPKTMAVDGEVREIDYSSSDARCLDGKRLVIVARNGDTIEYRTFPDDTHVKVVEHSATTHESYFEAFLPSGWIVEYGKTAGTRPRARNGAPRVWLAGETRDARGNSMSYGYCFAESDEGFTAEYALDEIRYTGFDGEAGTRAVSFVYGTKDPDDVRTIFSAGNSFQSSLRLDEVQTRVSSELVRRYEFAYEKGETTGRTRLVSAQECGADGACKPETRFQYAKATRGFDEITTTLQAPMSLRASPILADMNGDGLNDWFVPDMTAASTESKPITSWLMSANTGQGLSAPSQAFLQEWSFQQDPELLPDARLIQPELGTVIDYNQDGRMDVLLHDVYGNRNNHIVLLSKADGSFEEFDTGIQRPFPLGPAPKQLRGAGGSVHIADVDGDGVGDLIQCEDHGNSPQGDPSQSVWTLHLWRPGGFETNGASIEPLAGFSCAVELRTIDLNRNGKIDLVLPGMILIGGTPTTPTTTYSSLERSTDGTWKTWNTTLRIPPSPGRVIFADVNGDGLPDAITNGLPDGRLRTWINEDGHFATSPIDSLAWDGIEKQDAFIHLATPLDWDGDGRTDLLIPIGISPELPKWYILRATSGTNTFERIDAGIPFEAQLGEAVTLADPRGPRVGDRNGDGAPDVALFIGNVLRIFQNKASDPDVLVSYSDGMNDHDPDEPSFVPSVAISYGHLIDESRTTGQSPKETDFYIAHLDPANDCAYPRHCAVGAKRVVREYATNDGQGGQRRYGLRYRDGRYDRRGYGFLGFGERIVTDLDTNAGTATFYNNMTLVKVGTREVYPFAGQLKSQWRWATALPNEPKQNRVELAFVDSTVDVVPTNDGQTYFTLGTKLRTRRMQGTLSAAKSLETWVGEIEANENATMLRDTSVNVTDYDIFGNVLETDISTVGVDLTTHVTRVVKNDVDRWILGQLQERTECSKAGADEQCRILSRTTNTFGETESESTSDKNIPDTKLTVEYDKRDKYGNVEHVTAKDELGHVRAATTVFDEEGVFAVKEINALLHETVLEYDLRFGALKKETDPNQLVTEWQFDSLGRETLEKRPDGSQTTTTLSRSKMDGVWRLSARTKTTGGDDDETIFDSLGRPARTFSHGPTPKGQKTPRRMQVFGYDRLSGKTAKRSVLTAEGTPDDQLLFDVFEFDSIGREIRHATPWNATTTTSYDGLIIDSADLTTFPPRHTLTKLDSLGRPVTITDAKNVITSYTYGPFNTLRTVKDPGGATTTWTLDALGQPRSIDDPDHGVTVMQHDGFGELVTSTDALGRVTKFDIDEVGRVKARTDKLGAQVEATTWQWDTAPNGIGRLHTVTSPDAIQTISYTERGQIEGMMQTGGGDSFVARQEYDDVGLVKFVDYPQPLGEEPFGVMYARDEHGFVIGVHEKNTQEPFWTLTEVDDAGRTRKERFGNEVETTREYDNDKQTLKRISTTQGSTKIQDLSYEWTERLNLKSRTDVLQLQNKTERFRYDELDRVTCAYFGAVENAQAPCVTSYDYALNGNLTWKSDVGGTLMYDDLDHPHAITKASGANYGYDAVGNQITRPGGVSVTYTPFDLPRTITKGGKTASFGYDGNQQRIRKTTPAAETLYFGDIFEQITSAAGVVERRFYVHSPERAIAVVTRGGAKPGTRFFHTDHLGSIDTITKEDGTVDERRSYDAFGARRNPQWGGTWGAFTSSVTRGFTGHEEDDEFGLVNMKGRIFDPYVGRFATTDPILANIWDGQSHNRYAYVFNNPLAFVDPTGFQAQPQPNPGPEIYVDAEGNIGLRQWLIPPEPQKEDDFIIPNYAANIGAYVAPIDVETTGNPPPTSAPSEGIGSFFDGLLYGNLSDNTSWSATLGGIVGGLIPGVGLIADVRDLGAAVAHVADGKEGAWLELGASIIGFVPGGDIAKGIAKGATKATKAVAKVGAEVTDDVAKIAKGGTAAAADGLSAAEKAAGKVHAPRGPPSGNPRTATRAQRDAALERARGPDGIEKCIYCDQPLKRESGYSNSVEIDHRQPYVKGGQTVDTNLDAACRTCNRSKGSKGLGNEWLPPKDR